MQDNHYNSNKATNNSMTKVFQNYKIIVIFRLVSSAHHGFNSGGQGRRWIRFNFLINCDFDFFYWHDQPEPLVGQIDPRVLASFDEYNKKNHKRIIYIYILKVKCFYTTI